MDNIIKTPIIEETEQSFLDYSLSVITDRAIPSAEDGFKPVVRRILYDMYDNGYNSNKQYVKCASPVGDTMGRFHAHGDSSIYGALVGISQPWNMRYPLIDFHGNNGSRDGDGPAAYRYTECRLSKIAEATLSDIKKDTVDWIPNYSETEQEPVYLPGKFPNLLCNGTTGIAVAMACSFAPHNLKEVLNAAIAYEKDKESITSDELFNYIQGPDFPTGGTIINKDELKSAYLTGKGRVKVRGDYKIENNNGKKSIIFISIPYKVSKEDLIIEIDDLCEKKEIEGIQEIRDESNKDGVRFVIELAKGIDEKPIINRLYKLTNLETTFNINQVALINKQPKLMTLRDLISSYVEHQEEVFKRKTEFDYQKVQNRIHILLGLSVAVENIDKIIKTIKSSNNPNSAKEALIKEFSFSDVQAQAILDMKLSKLSHIEKIAIDNELQEKNNIANHLSLILKDRVYATNSLIEEFENFKNLFSDERRTKIIQEEKKNSEKEEIIPEDCVVIITKAGNIKRIPYKNFRTQNRNGKGVKTQDDITHSIIKTNTVDSLLVFTNYGKVYRIDVNKIPAGNNTTKGVPISSLVSLQENEEFSSIISVKDNEKEEEKYMWFFTKNGLIKKTPIKDFLNIKKSGSSATSIREGDSIIDVITAKDQNIFIFTKNGMSLRFDGKSVSPTTKVSTGIKAITLKENDSVISALMTDNINKTPFIILSMEDGTVKKIATSEFNIQNRAGKGNICNKISSIVDATFVNENDNILIVGESSSICINTKDIKAGNKSTMGIKAIKDTKIIATIKI